MRIYAIDATNQRKGKYHTLCASFILPKRRKNTIFYTFIFLSFFSILVPFFSFFSILSAAPHELEAALARHVDHALAPARALGTGRLRCVRVCDVIAYSAAPIARPPPNRDPPMDTTSARATPSNRGSRSLYSLYSLFTSHNVGIAYLLPALQQQPCRVNQSMQ